jgi:hypothetical protein
MEIMLKNKNGFQVNISLSIFFIAFCDLFTDFPSYIALHCGAINMQYLNMTVTTLLSAVHSGKDSLLFIIISV